MNVYLAKFTLKNKVAYKVGHTKYFYAHKRFDDDQYKIFDQVEILDQIRISHNDPKIARTYVKLVEETLKAIFPKDFVLEDHFVMEAKTFDGLSGITEMFLHEDENNLLKIFSRVKRNVEKVSKE